MLHVFFGSVAPSFLAMRAASASLRVTLRGETVFEVLKNSPSRLGLVQYTVACAGSAAHRAARSNPRGAVRRGSFIEVWRSFCTLESNCQQSTGPQGARRMS